jgi:hypothetical protein
MNSYVYVFAILVAGFLIYFLFKDKFLDLESSITGNPVNKENFEVPAPASIELRKAPIYPERTVMPSGPNPPSQSPPNGQINVYGEPAPQDPYYESQESSDIPENLRYPERSFRSPPLNNNTSIAVDAGIASNIMQISSDNSQQFNPDFIQNGGEFMKGIFANDTYSGTSYSAF